MDKLGRCDFDYMWNFAHYKHCDVLDKFKQMLVNDFCILYGEMGKKTRKSNWRI